MPYLWPWWEKGSEYQDPTRKPGSEAGGGVSPAVSSPTTTGTARPAGTGFTNLQAYMRANQGYGAPDVYGSQEEQAGKAAAAKQDYVNQQEKYDLDKKMAEQFNQSITGAADWLQEHPYKPTTVAGHWEQGAQGSSLPGTRLQPSDSWRSLSPPPGGTTRNPGNPSQWWVPSGPSTDSYAMERPGYEQLAKETPRSMGEPPSSAVAETAAKPVTDALQRAGNWEGRKSLLTSMAGPGYNQQYSGFDAMLAGARPFQEMAKGYPGLSSALAEWQPALAGKVRRQTQSPRGYPMQLPGWS